MASVTNLKSCKDCGGVELESYYHKIGKTHSFCYRCGSAESERTIMEYGEPLIGSDNRPITVQDSVKGYGRYSIVFKDGGMQSGGFNKPVTSEVVERFERTIAEDKGVDLDKTFLTKWEDNKLTILIGENIPKINQVRFDEWEAKTKETVESQ